MIRLGAFDAERRWRPRGLAVLPALRDPEGDRTVAAMDELLAAACGPTDLLITSAEPPGALLRTLAAAGLPTRHRVAPAPGPGSRRDAAGPDVTDAANNDAVTVEQRLLASPPGDLVEYGIAPYAVLPETAALAGQCAPGSELPDADTVRAVSSKTWSNAFVRNHGLPGAGDTVRSVAELHARITAFDGATALVKDPYGVAGRGTITVSSPRVLRSVTRTLEAQAERGAAVELLVQRQYEKAADFSAHLEIAPDGTVDWLGVQLMHNTGFSYAGSRPVPEPLARRLAGCGYREVMEKTGAALAAAGYHGPVCVDSMTLHDGTLVPVLEINPRMSMGLISLLLGRRLAGAGTSARLAVRGLRLPATGPGHPRDPAPSSPDDEAGRVSRRYGALVTALDGQDALYRAGGTGVLPLTANTLRSPRARLYYAVVARDAEQDRLLEDAMDRVARSLERTAGEVSHAS
ncbi:hypothetical protein AB0P17_31585 [Streptomyces sp. NPDC088124]|uniref:hypothetical protein n=1 Tax=Streptomyces sp. NPDC088124 TaxID=3154654 RepID=UPI003443FC35